MALSGIPRADIVRAIAESTGRPTETESGTISRSQHHRRDDVRVLRTVLVATGQRLAVVGGPAVVVAGRPTSTCA